MLIGMYNCAFESQRHSATILKRIFQFFTKRFQFLAITNGGITIAGADLACSTRATAAFRPSCASEITSRTPTISVGAPGELAQPPASREQLPNRASFAR